MSTEGQEPKESDAHSEPRTDNTRWEDSVVRVRSIDELFQSAEESRQAKNKDDTESQSFAEFAAELKQLKLEDHHLDHALKKVLGYGTVVALGAQILATNFFCVWYGLHLVHTGQDVPTEALIGWMSATIVEIIALALVVTKYLFPDSGNNWNHEPQTED